MAPENVSVQGPDAPLAHRRPGYSSSGCTPAEPDSASPGIDYSTQAQGEVPRTGDGREGNDIRVHEVSGQDRERDSGCIPRSDMAHCDAAGVNGSNRILSHGAPLLRMMPNGCLGSPVIVLLFGLDRGFLMDVRPEHARGRFVALRCRLPLTNTAWPGFVCSLANTLNELLNG